MTRFVTLLSALCAIILATSQHASAARHGGNDDGPNDNNNNQGGNSRKCRDTFDTLCVKPCTNSTTGILDLLDCEIDCFRANAASLRGCHAPTIPRGLLKRTNCSEVFRNRCDECNSTTGLEELTCANECVKDRMASFRDCRHTPDEFFGDHNLTSNCTREVRGRCQRCLRGSLNMEEKTACLVKCVADPQLRARCTKPPRDGNGGGNGGQPQRNCTEAFAQCPTCANLRGRDRLQCLADCDVVKNERGCFLGPLNRIPGLGGSAACLAAVGEKCNACANAAGGLREQLKCLRDCIGDQPACRSRDQRECVDEICASCKRLPGNQRRACTAQCLVNNAGQIADCVTGD